MSKNIAHIWSWKPHDELPRDQVKEKGFPTPTLEAVKFTADGRYVLVREIPGYPTDTYLHGEAVRVPAEFREWEGSWKITDGELDMHRSDKGWAAKLREHGWRETDKPVPWERSFKITKAGHAELRLKTLADFDFDRTFHRAQAMPKRPVTIN